MTDKFNPFEDGKEWKDREPDDDEGEEGISKDQLIDEILDWYINDTEESVEFIDNVKAIFKAATGKEYDAAKLKEDILEMIKSGDIKVYYDIAHEGHGLMLKVGKNLWKEV